MKSKQIFLKFCLLLVITTVPNLALDNYQGPVKIHEYIKESYSSGLPYEI